MSDIRHSLLKVAVPRLDLASVKSLSSIEGWFTDLRKCSNAVNREIIAADVAAAIYQFMMLDEHVLAHALARDPITILGNDPSRGMVDPTAEPIYDTFSGRQPSLQV